MRRTVVGCDRCAAVIPDDDRRASRAYAATREGLDLVGTEELAADLCSSCTSDLVRFMSTPPARASVEPLSKPRGTR